MLNRIIDGRTDLVFDFLAKGNSVFSKDEYGVSVMNWCAYHGDVSAIRFLLENGENLSSLGHNFDLNNAVFHGHWQLCEFLMDNGADVNLAISSTGETPLHSALCKANRPVYDNIVMLLLSKGADPNKRTAPNVNTGSFMRDCRTKSESPLHRAAAYGTERSIDFLLEAGANRELKDMNGDSPLTWASEHLRPASILRKLCYSEFSIRPENRSSYDHGTGWSQIDPPLGRPHI